MADIIITAAVIALPTMMIFYAIGARTYRMYAQHRIQKQFNDLMTQVVMKECAEAISKKEQIDELLAKPFDEMLKTYGSDPKFAEMRKVGKHQVEEWFGGDVPRGVEAAAATPKPNRDVRYCPRCQAKSEHLNGVCTCSDIFDVVHIKEPAELEVVLAWLEQIKEHTDGAPERFGAEENRLALHAIHALQVLRHFEARS